MHHPSVLGCSLRILISQHPTSQLHGLLSPPFLRHTFSSTLESTSTTQRSAWCTTVVLQSLHDRMLEVSPPLVPFIWCLLGGVNQTDGLGFHRWQSFRLVISLKLAQEFLVSVVAVVIGNSGWFVDWTLRVSLPLVPLLWYLLGGVNQTDGLGFCWQWSFWLVVSLKLVQKFLVGAKRAMGRLPWSLATSDGSFIGHLE